MNQQEKDIINKIAEGIKSQPERPYKEGAWERFRDEKLIAKPTSSNMRGMYIKWSSVAAIFLMISGVLFYKYRDTQNSIELPLSQVNETLEKEITPYKAELDEDQAKDINQSISVEDGNKQQIAARMDRNSIQSKDGIQREDLLINDMEGRAMREDDYSFKIVSLDINALKLKEARINLSNENDYAKSADNMDMYRSLGQQYIGKAQIYTKNDFQPKRQVMHKFTDRLNLGLFVSSMSTDQKMNFGGGLLMSYDLTSNLSIRTGLSFSQYEVGQMKDPAVSQEFSAITTEKKSGAMSDIQNSPSEGPVSGGSSFAVSSRDVLVPNINAVSAQVQSFDIPVEMKYQFGQGFYSTAGMSYSKVINQKRYAYYDEVDNIYMLGKQEQHKVTKTVESVDNMLSNDKFGGFVNLSFGKKVSVNKKALSLSVEPYIKLPVGQFRKSDLNYTNGGIRIITNFR